MKCAGALFDVDSTQAHAAFRFEMERYNNISASTFKLDKYEKIVDVTDSFQLAKAGQCRNTQHLLLAAKANIALAP